MKNGYIIRCFGCARSFKSFERYFLHALRPQHGWRWHWAFHLEPRSAPEPIEESTIGPILWEF